MRYRANKKVYWNTDHEMLLVGKPGLFIRPSQGFGEQGSNGIYFKGTREQRSKNEGNRGTMAILGEIKILILGNSDLFQGNKGTGISPLSHPPPLPTLSGKGFIYFPGFKLTMMCLFKRSFILACLFYRHPDLTYIGLCKSSVLPNMRKESHLQTVKWKKICCKF